MQVVEVTGVGNVEFPDDMSHEDIIHAIETDILPPPQAQEELPSRTVGDVVKDTGIIGARGVVSAAQGVEGLADLLPGVNATKYLSEHGVDLGKANEYLQERASPQQQQAYKNLTKAKGAGNILGAAIDNPSAVAELVGENIIPMLTGGLEARVLTKGVPALAKYAPNIGEGLMQAGQEAQKLTAESPDKELTGKGELAAIGSGAMDAVLGRLMGKLVSKHGGTNVEDTLYGTVRSELGEEAARNPGVIKKLIVSTLGETAEEALQGGQERIWDNYAKGATNLPSLLEGAADDATLGAILGAVMGGGAGSVNAYQTRGGQEQPTQPEAEQPAQPEAEQPAQPEAEQPAQPQPGTQDTAVDIENGVENSGVSTEPNASGTPTLFDELIKPEHYASHESLDALDKYKNSVELPGAFDDAAWNEHITKQRERLGTREEIAPEVQPEQEPKPSIATSDENTAHTIETLTPYFTPQMRALVKSGKLTLHDSLDTFPGENHPEGVQGLTTPQGEVHLLANKLTPESMPRVALHEMGVHVGMKGMVGDKVWGDLTSQALTTKGGAFEAARRSVPEDTPEHLKGEETLAYLVENAPHLPIVKRTVAAIKNWIRTTFGARLSITEADIHHLATKALRKESLTSARSVREGTAYAQKPRENSRIGMPHEQVLQRVPELTESAEKMMDMLYDNGMLVRGTKGNLAKGVSNKDVKNFALSNPEFRKLAEAHDALVEKYKPVEPYQSLPTPATEAEMREVLKDKQVVNIYRPIPDGYKVKFRLDIPAYKNKGVWVATVHEGNTEKNSIFGVKEATPIAYYGHAVGNNPKFSIDEVDALKIAGKTRDKYPLATVDAEYVNMSAEEAKRQADKAMTDPDWVQVGMDPERHSRFYDRKTMQPVKSGSKIIQIGSILMIKDPVYGKKSEYVYSVANKLKAPNGKPSNLNAMQHAQVRTPAFKAWFGDWEKDNTSSDIVGANTEPLVVYRGNVADFGGTFAYGVVNLAHKSVKNTFGFFFTTEPVDARHYTASNMGNTQAVFLNIRNPIRIREEYISDIAEFKEAMKAAGVPLSNDTVSSITNYLEGITSKFDLHATHKYLTGGGSLLRRDLISAGYDGMLFIESQHDGAIIVAFNPNQIKSAIGNTGAFDKKNNDIRYSLSNADKLKAQVELDKKNVPTAKESWTVSKKPMMSNLTRVIDIFEQQYMSHDAVLVNSLRRYLEKIGATTEYTLTALTRSNQMQAVNATSVAAEFTLVGGGDFDSMGIWSSKYSDDNLVSLRQSVDDGGAKQGWTQRETHAYFTNYMVSKRILGLFKEAETHEATANAIVDKDEKAVWLEKAKEIRAILKRDGAIKAKSQATADAYGSIEEFVKAEKMWHAVRANLIKTLVKSGLFSQEKADVYAKALAYVPFNRVMENLTDTDSLDSFIEGMGNNNVGGHRVSALTNGMSNKKLKGSERDVMDIMSNMEAWSQISFTSAIRAKKATDLIDVMRKSMPVGTVTRVHGSQSAEDKAKTVVTYSHGKKQSWMFEDVLMVSAFRGTPSAALIVPLLTASGNIMRSGIVLAPTFTLGQLPQDIYSAFFTAGIKNPFKLAYDLATEFGTTAFSKKDTDTHLILKRMGAVGAKDNIADSKSTHIHDISFHTHYDDETKTVTAKAWRGLKTKLEKFAMAGDNAIRQAVYKRSMEELKGNPNAKAIATQRAFDVINFRRRGASAVLEQWRSNVPFMGATIQAQRAAFQVLAGRGLAHQDKAEVYKRIIYSSLTMMAMTLVYNVLYGSLLDDDEFKKKSNRDKDSRIFLLGGNSPVSFAIRSDIWSMPFVGGNHLYQALVGREDAAQARDALLHTLFMASGLGAPMAPPLLKEIAQYGANYDFFTERPIVPERLQRRATAEQYDAATSELGKIAGKVGMSPIKFDHIVSSLFSGTGKLVLVTSNVASFASNVSVKDHSLRELVRMIPGTSSIVPVGDSFEATNLSFKVRREVETANNTYNSLVKDKLPAEAKAYKLKHKALLNPALITATNLTTKTVDDLHAQLRQIHNSKNLNAAQKKVKEDLINKKVQVAHERYSKWYHKLPM